MLLKQGYLFCMVQMILKKNKQVVEYLIHLILIS